MAHQDIVELAPECEAQITPLCSRHSSHLLFSRVLCNLRSRFFSPVKVTNITPTIGLEIKQAQ